MSDTENNNDTVDAGKNALSGGLASVMALKSSNPKYFFGGGAALLVLFIVMLTMGGDDEKVVVAAGGAPAKNLAVGQKYILKNPNSYDDKATVQLVPVPGTIAAYDESEDDAKNPCRKIVQGTPVSVMAFQDAYGKSNTFAQVKIEDGACKDKDGWVLSVDLQ